MAGEQARLSPGDLICLRRWDSDAYAPTTRVMLRPRGAGGALLSADVVIVVGVSTYGGPARPGLTSSL